MAGSKAEEVLSSIKTVMAFDGQNKEIERYITYVCMYVCVCVTVYVYMYVCMHMCMPTLHKNECMSYRFLLKRIFMYVSI